MGWRESVVDGDALGVLEAGWQACESASCDLVLIRKMGLTVAALVSSSSQLVVEAGARVVARIPIPGRIESLKTRLKS